MNQILKQLNKIRVPESELEILSHSDGGYMKYGYKNQPFTGNLAMDYHPNGYIMYEEEFKEGEHLGWDNLYYENGQLERETLMVGATTLYFLTYDEEGNATNEKWLQVPQEMYDKMVIDYNLD